MKVAIVCFSLFAICFFLIAAPSQAPKSSYLGTNTTVPLQIAYPTLNYTVHGYLTTTGGKHLPNAPVMIEAFGKNYSATTNAAGSFSKELTVPGNAAVGTYYVTVSFAPEGTFGPSINLTAVQVVKLPQTFTVNPQSIFFSGWTNVVSGQAVANGTLLGNDTVIVETPWGDYRTLTDTQGNYNIQVPVPLSNFGSSESLAFVANPGEAYVASASTTRSVTILNPLEIIIPLLVIGFGTYEARNLNLIPSLRKRLSRPKKEQTLAPGEEPKEDLVPEAEIPAQVSDSPSIAREVPRLVMAYKEALLLASRKFGIQFSKDLTIRETIALVSGYAKDSAGLNYFSNIALATEDYIYSERTSDYFKLTSPEEIENVAQSYLVKLKELWLK
ncbi:MAG: hypothetical protein ACYCQJ_03675 [Nitrososphaerales archaeon]